MNHPFDAEQHGSDSPYERLSQSKCVRIDGWFVSLLRIAAAVSMAVTTPMRDASAATADLPKDAARLVAAWTTNSRGLDRVERLAPMFLERGHPRTVRLPPSAYDTSDGRCTSLAFLAGRSVDFSVHIDPIIVPKHRPTGGFVQRSVAGAALLVRCGAHRQELERLAVDLRASRAALEIIMADGPTPAGEVSTALPERGTGPLAPPIDPGPRPTLLPLETRVRQAELRATRAGATRVERREITTGPEGVGSETMDFAEGCHRISIMARSAPEAPIDIDAELRDVATGRVLSRDRSDAGDAQLETCVGAPARLMLVYTGAPGRDPLVLTDGVFAIPPGVPSEWGARARAGLSSALFRHKVAPVSMAPTDLRLGATGVTPLRMLVEPGSCYVSALTALAGDPRLIALTASIDAHQAYDAVVQGSDGAAIAFCVEQFDRVDFQAEVRGGSATWLLASWKVADIRLGGKRW